MSGATNALYAPLNLNEELMRTLFPTLLHRQWPLLTIQTFCHFPLATCHMHCAPFRFRYDFGLLPYSAFFSEADPACLGSITRSLAPPTFSLPPPLALNLMLFVRQWQIAMALLVAALRFVLSFCGMLPPWPGLNDTLAK